MVPSNGLSPTLPPLVLCVSVKMGRNHRGVCRTMFVAMYLRLNCLGPASMSNKSGADWTNEKRIDLSLVDPPSHKFSGTFADTVSTLWNPFDFSTPSLPDDSGNLGGTPLYSASSDV